MSFLDEYLKKITDEVSRLKRKVTFLSDSNEINPRVSDHHDRTLTNEVIVEDLFLMEGEQNLKRVQVLKDEGCNTNMVSYYFFQNHCELLRIARNSLKVRP